jgi:hypothetical protein
MCPAPTDCHATELFFSSEILAVRLKINPIPFIIYSLTKNICSQESVNNNKAESLSKIKMVAARSTLQKEKSINTEM